LGFGQRYHVDRHGQLTLKQLRLSVLNEMHTNSYTGPRLIEGIERKEWLELLGVTFEDDVCCWDLHVDGLLSKDGSRMYILRVCRRYGYRKEHLSYLLTQ
jgi:hypothetical protein